MQSFLLAQKCRARISEFWSNFTFLLELQIKFVLNLTQYKRRNEENIDKEYIDVMIFKGSSLRIVFKRDKLALFVRPMFISLSSEY